MCTCKSKCIAVLHIHNKILLYCFTRFVFIIVFSSLTKKFATIPSLGFLLRQDLHQGVSPILPSQFSFFMVSWVCTVAFLMLLFIITIYYFFSYYYFL